MNFFNSLSSSSSQMEGDEGGGGGEGGGKKKEKPCRACHDFKSWAKMKGHEVNKGGGVLGGNGENVPPHATAECPLDKDDLGRSTWALLHTMAAYYPDKPSDQEQKEMSVFIKLFSKFYPCDHCAKDFRKSIKVSPPDTKTRWSLSQWFCRMHNEVNRKLGKEEFDCALVDQRWKDGWDDGSCG